MAIQRGVIKAQIASMIERNKANNAEDGEEFFAEELTNIVVDAILSITITIPPSAIVTVGSPSTQSNVAPVVLTNTVT